MSKIILIIKNLTVLVFRNRQFLTKNWVVFNTTVTSPSITINICGEGNNALVQTKSYEKGYLQKCQNKPECSAQWLRGLFEQTGQVWNTNCKKISFRTNHAIWQILPFLFVTWWGRFCGGEVSEERNIGQILAWWIKNSISRIVVDCVRYYTWLPPRLSPYSPNPARHRAPHIQPLQIEQNFDLSENYSKF